MTLLAYLSHPIGPGNGHAMVQKQDNIANASEWLRFLVETTRWAVVCPWFPYLASLGTESHRPRGLMDQLFVLERCDLLVLCGGWVSPHMRMEHARALRHGIPIVDLTDFGDRPPRYGSEEFDRASPTITVRAVAAIQALPRRVWLPPLTQGDVSALQNARTALLDDPKFKDACELIHRIMLATGKNPR